jgi:hypothetical protein
MIDIQYLKGDATCPQSAGVKIICHVCNDLGGWDKGFVLALSRRWPEPEEAYRTWYRERKSNDFGCPGQQKGNVQLLSFSAIRLFDGIHEMLGLQVQIPLCRRRIRLTHQFSKNAFPDTSRACARGRCEPHSEKASQAAASVSELSLPLTRILSLPPALVTQALRRLSKRGCGLRTQAPP